mmetsp:Transcript_89644/g.192090  ORF Transcript_89644/g.192090 Transcript_89644/m.192090 type:complete len:200 (-) Transcript_89644:86-685(-)
MCPTGERKKTGDRTHVDAENKHSAPMASPEGVRQGDICIKANRSKAENVATDGTIALQVKQASSTTDEDPIRKQPPYNQLDRFRANIVYRWRSSIWSLLHVKCNVDDGVHQAISHHRTKYGDRRRDHRPSFVHNQWHVRVDHVEDSHDEGHPSQKDDASVALDQRHIVGHFGHRWHDCCVRRVALKRLFRRGRIGASCR